MNAAGYSGTPLIDKLGIEPDMKIRVVNPPFDYPDLLGADITDQICRPKERTDLVHLFATSEKQFRAGMKKLSGQVSKNPNIIIWVSWYKKTTRIPTDLTEDVIRDYALKNGLVDVKVCAVSDIWSGLKLVVPLKNRK